MRTTNTCSKSAFLTSVVTLLAVALSAELVQAQGDKPPAPVNVGAPVRKVSYVRSESRSPSWQQTNRVHLAGNIPEEVVPGEIIEDGPVYSHDRVVVGDGYGFVDDGYGDCADGSCGGGGCASCGDCGSCGPPGGRFNYCAGLLFENLEVSAGVTGFKGPLDFGENGNFGFQYGVNLGLPLLPDWGIGWQIGARGVSTNFEGNQFSGTDTSRDQVFSTIGVFHHATECNPWTWGIVYDQLHDEYWDEFDFSQVRGELGFVTNRCNEFGVMVTVHTDTQEVDGLIGFDGVEAQDQYAVYFRRYLCNDGEIRGWVGISGDGEGVFGGDFTVPISDRFGFQANFNYLIPDDSLTPNVQQRAEAWGLGMNLVWHTRPGAFAHRKNPWHAMFNVADNASFLTRFVE